jgi:hypothetical protein
MSARRKCSAKNKAGNPCGLWAMKGGFVCGKHGGRAPQVAAKAAVRAELSAWGVTDEKIDPGEQLLRLVTQSAARGDLYKTGEYIRGLARIEADERDRCATFCTKAVAAGLMQKQTDLAKAQGELLVKSLQVILDRVSLTDGQKQEVKRELKAIGATA